MIHKISIQQSKGLVFTGLAIAEKDGEQQRIDFDVLKSYPLQVIVSGRGKTIPHKDADMYESRLYELLLKHDVLKKLGVVALPVTKKRNRKVAI